MDHKFYFTQIITIESGDIEVQILSDNDRINLFEKLFNINKENQYTTLFDLMEICKNLVKELNISVGNLDINDDYSISFIVFDGNKYEYVKFNPRKEKLEKIITKI